VEPTSRRRPEGEAEAGAGAPGLPRQPAQKRKPMTVEEAVLEMEKTRDYLVYRDAKPTA
jgi:hypothetical protein